MRVGEECDDHNLRSATAAMELHVEPGCVCAGQPSVCTQFTVTITSPAHGIFTTASSVTVTGTVNNLPRRRGSSP